MQQLPQRDIKAFLVWEPVLDSDTEAPSLETMARAADPRVRHFWDPKLLLATFWQPILRAETTPVLGKASLVQGRILWDFVAVFPPGVRWEATMPSPAFKAAPVTAHESELLVHLRSY